MVDTGIGPGPHPSRGNRTGDMLNQLKIAGVNPEDVDLVLITHMHIDHVGWNVDYTGSEPKPYFPNARYLAPQLDWDHFTKPEFAKDAPWVAENILPLEKMGLLQLIKDGHVVSDEIKAISTPGHTPGHMSLMISSQGENGLVLGDVLHNTAQIENTDWVSRADIDPAQTRITRRNLIDRLEREGIPGAAVHLARPGFGKIVRENGRRFWQAV